VVASLSWLGMMLVGPVATGGDADRSASEERPIGLKVLFGVKLWKEHFSEGTKDRSVSRDDCSSLYDSYSWICL